MYAGTRREVLWVRCEKNIIEHKYLPNNGDLQRERKRGLSEYRDRHKEETDQRVAWICGEKYCFSLRNSCMKPQKVKQQFVEMITVCYISCSVQDKRDQEQITQGKTILNNKNVIFSVPVSIKRGISSPFISSIWAER